MNFKNLEKLKKSWKCVNIQAKQCRSPFNLTNFWHKIQNSIFKIFVFFFKTELCSLIWRIFCCFRRQKELEQRNIEEEANKRIEELVAKRVEEELERRREEIEAEVLRRVEEAKKVMEAEMLQEMERRKQEQLEEARRREVRLVDYRRLRNCRLASNSHHHQSRFLRKLVQPRWMVQHMDHTILVWPFSLFLLICYSSKPIW